MNENDHHREVYAHFGLAIFKAQVLEHAIVNALIICDLIPNQRDKALSAESWAADVDQITDGHFAGVLGRMIKSLRKVAAVSAELEASLESSLKMRNFLAHRYFRERDTAWLTEEGRDGMIEELLEACRLFDRTDGLIDELIKPLSIRYGLTEDVIERELAAYRAEALKRMNA